jgi:hypothetical protein
MFGLSLLVREVGALIMPPMIRSIHALSRLIRRLSPGPKTELHRSNLFSLYLKETNTFREDPPGGLNNREERDGKFVRNRQRI